MPRLLPLLFCACTCLIPATAWAGDVPDTEAAAAAAVGRGLLSPHADERRAAQARLLARVRQGGDLEGFLRAMSEGVAEWANRHERLMELWLHRAVHGEAGEREEAVRLLAALGAPAIRRLALELRHARQHADGGAEEEPAAAPTSPPGGSSEPVPTPGEPRLYELKDLVTAGMNPVQLRSLLQKAADAHEVKQHGTTWIVTAAPRGHELLITRLHALRQARSRAPQQADEADPAPPSPPDAAPPPPAVQPTPDVPAPATAVPKAFPSRGLAPLWRVRSVFVHVPEQALLPAAWQSATVQVGTLQQVRDWSQVARQVPEARGDEPSGARGPLKLGEELDLFSGRELRYSKDVRRTKGGAYRIVTGTIQHGLGLRLRMTPTQGGVHVDVSARKTEVGLPIPVFKVKPSFDAAAVELERPEWSTTTSRAAFDLPPEGGGALLALDGLTTRGGDRILLIVTVRPEPDPGAKGQNAAK